MFQRLLELLALSLESRNIPYMVVGGQAVLLYGEPRLTRDIDVTLGVGPERLAEILSMVADLGWTSLPDSPDDFVRKSLVLPCIESVNGIRIDLIFSYSEYERQALGRVRQVRIGRADVRFVSVEDLIVHKMVAGRPRDIEDVKSILLKNPRVDTAYIRRWLGEFDRTLGEKYTQQFDRLRESTLPAT